LGQHLQTLVVSLVLIAGGIKILMGTKQPQKDRKVDDICDDGE